MPDMPSASGFVFFLLILKVFRHHLFPELTDTVDKVDVSLVLRICQVPTRHQDQYDPHFLPLVRYSAL